ncbi:MAG: ABC transporter permease subunit [Actinobacteria bacterium]|nr:ABC transporter permease subunit [Actinomycetota bacterium]
MKRTPTQVLVVIAAAPAAITTAGATLSVLAQSIGLLPLTGPPEISAKAFADIAGVLPESTAVSLWIAAASTTLAVLVGGSAGILIGSGGRLARALGGVGAAVVTVPHLIGAAAFWLLLTETGLVPSALGVGADDWPPLVAGPWWAAVILEYAWKESAFVALVVAGALATRIAHFDETAATLGARPVTRLRLVTLPLVLPSIIVSGTIVFVYTLGSYEVAWLLGRTHPEPLAVTAVRLYTAVELSARPAAAAVAASIIALSAIAAAIGFLLLRRTAAWR